MKEKKYCNTNAYERVLSSEITENAVVFMLSQQMLQLRFEWFRYVIKTPRLTLSSILCYYTIQLNNADIKIED